MLKKNNLWQEFGDFFLFKFWQDEPEENAHQLFELFHLAKHPQDAHHGARVSF